jgi:hypothetical protein
VGEVCEGDGGAGGVGYIGLGGVALGCETAGLWAFCVEVRSRMRFSPWLLCSRYACSVTVTFLGTLFTALS